MIFVFCISAKQSSHGIQNLTLMWDTWIWLEWSFQKPQNVLLLTSNKVTPFWNSEYRGFFSPINYSFPGKLRNKFVFLYLWSNNWGGVTLKVSRMSLWYFYHFHSANLWAALYWQLTTIFSSKDATSQIIYPTVQLIFMEIWLAAPILPKLHPLCSIASQVSER